MRRHADCGDVHFRQRRCCRSGRQHTRRSNRLGRGCAGRKHLLGWFALALLVPRRQRRQTRGVVRRRRRLLERGAVRCRWTRHVSDQSRDATAAEQRSVRSATQEQSAARLQRGAAAVLYRRRAHRPAHRRIPAIRRHALPVRARRRAQHDRRVRLAEVARLRSAHAVRQRRERRCGGRRLLGGGDRQSLAASAVDRARRFRRRISIVGRERRAAPMGCARRAAGSTGLRRTRSRVLRVVLHRRRAEPSERAARPGELRRRCGAAPLHVAVGHTGETADEAADLQPQRGTHRCAGVPQLHLSGQTTRDTANRRRLLDALRGPEPRELGGRSARGTTTREPLVRWHDSVARKSGHRTRQTRQACRLPSSPSGETS